MQSLAELLWLVRIGLATCLIVHIISAVYLKLKSISANPTKYQVANYFKAKLTSRTMLWTGVLLLVCIVMHLLHFTAGVVDIEGGYEQYELYPTRTYVAGGDCCSEKDDCCSGKSGFQSACCEKICSAVCDKQNAGCCKDCPEGDKMCPKCEANPEMCSKNLKPDCQMVCSKSSDCKDACSSSACCSDEASCCDGKDDCCEESDESCCDQEC